MMTTTVVEVRRRSLWRRVCALAARYYGPLCVLAYLAAALAIFAPALGNSRFVFGTDTYSHDYIMHLYGWRQIEDTGRWPLWCPYLFCGTPFIASFALCPFYPSQMAYFLFPHNTAFTLQYVLALVLAAAFFALWMRRGFKLSRPVAFWAGAAFMVSGHFLTLTHAGHLQKMIAIAWAPLALCAAQRLARLSIHAQDSSDSSTPSAKANCLARWLWALALATALAMQLLASHTQIFYATAAVSIGYLVLALCLRLLSRRTRPGTRALALRLGGLLAVSLLFALAFSAIQMFPGAEMSAISNRAHGVSFDEAVSTSYPPRELLEYAIPRVFGDSVQGSQTPYFGAWGERIVSDFLGAPLLLLGLLGLVRGRKALRLGLLLLLALSLLIGVGKYTPLYRAFYVLLPGFSRFRSPGTFMFLADMAIVALGALGLQALLNLCRRTPGLPAARQGGRWTASALGLAAAAALLLVLYSLWARSDVLSDRPTQEELKTYYLYRGAILLGCELAAAALLGALALVAARGRWRRASAFALVLFAGLGLGAPLVHNHYFIRFWDLQPYLGYLEFQRVYATLSRVQERPVRLLEERALKVDNILHQVGSPTGYHPVVLGSYEALMQALGYTSPSFTQMFSINFAHTYSDRPPSAGSWQALQQFPEESVWRASSMPSYAKPRVRLIETDNRAETLEQLKEGFPIPEAVFVEKQTLARHGCAPGLQRTSGELLEWRANVIRLNTYSSDQAILPISEVYAPGWKARTDNGRLLELVPVNLAQRALVLPGGASVVSMTYEPFSYRLGAFLTLLGFGVVCTAGAMVGIQRMQRAKA